MSEHGLCPICGGELIDKQVEVLLRGGDHTAVVHVPAFKCVYCREVLYVASIAREFERITSQLSRGDTDDFKPLGRVFEVELHHVPHLKMIIDKPVVTAKTANTGG